MKKIILLLVIILYFARPIKAYCWDIPDNSFNCNIGVGKFNLNGIKDFSLRSNNNNVYCVFCKSNSGTNNYDLIFYSIYNNSIGYVTLDTSEISYSLTSKYKNAFYYVEVNLTGLKYTTETNIPNSGLNFSDTLEYIYNGGSWGDGAIVDLGNLQNIGYYVDSIAFNQDPYNNNEYISWGQYSSTDIDLSNSRYQVEIAISDTSYKWLKSGIAPNIWPFGGTIESIGNAVNGVATLLGSFIYPDGSDQKALIQGQSVRTGLYGSIGSVKKVSASTYKTGINAYNYYSNSSYVQSVDTDFYDFITYTKNNTGRNDWWQKWTDYFNQTQYAYNLSYNILARIVDTQTGQTGTWTIIDKHNTPYQFSDDKDRLNGGVTSVSNITIKDGNTIYNPKNDFSKSPTYNYEYNYGDNYSNPVTTGYYDQSTNNTTNVYNNYIYNYNYGDTIYNNYTNEDQQSVNEGFSLIRSLKPLLGLYLAFFGAFLPPWAVTLVGILIPLSIGIMILRAIKGVIPFV